MIRTERLLLRYFVPDDWAAVHAYASIPDVSQFDSWGPNTEADSRTFVEHCIQFASQDPVERHDFAIIVNADGRLIGGCSLKLQSMAEGSLGYAIHPDYQGMGFATEATRAMIDFGFRDLRLERIVAQCDTRNSASFRVMEKAGMARVGTHLKHREIKGRLSHSYEYAIDRPADGGA
jgi:RimJ/RimL family protein N-acetyltransferase